MYSSAAFAFQPNFFRNVERIIRNKRVASIGLDKKMSVQMWILNYQFKTFILGTRLIETVL